MTHKSAKDDVAARKLIDRLVPDFQLGAVEALLATSYEMDAEFLETDFLPMALGQAAWNDRARTSRIALERELALMQAAVVMIDAHGYHGRPRSLRVDTRPALAPGGQKLHAKIVLLVQQHAVRLIVGSSNLTPMGYRKNREVICALHATRKNPEAGALIMQALAETPERLATWWLPNATKARDLAIARLRELGASPPAAAADDRFVWGGGPTPLWRAFLEQWPANEKIESIDVVSPFWSGEDKSGPFHVFLGELARRSLTTPSTALRLLADAEPYGTGDLRPRLHPSLGELDFKTLGITARAEAVDNAVLKEEVGTDQFLEKRALHAKVVLVSGAKTSLAYLGSANFTRRGWGFHEAVAANVEAGLILRRRGKARAELARLLPPTSGAAVPLDGHARARIALPVDGQEAPSWPAFIVDLSLDPSARDPNRLALKVVVDVARVHGQWSAVLDGEATPLFRGAAAATSEQSAPTEQSVELTPEQLERILMTQELTIHWWDGPKEGRRFPVNVHADARPGLPIAPGAGAPGESALLAYYQGKIAWEDLFPATEVGTSSDDDDENGPLRALDAASEVDTSRIQSYQIRSFVEALGGMSRVLREARTSEPTIRLALQGHVSPVGLARCVINEVKAKTRTPTAAAFQLVEILAVLNEARTWDVPPACKEPWQLHLGAAVSTVTTIVEAVLQEHEAELGPATAFARYAKRVQPELSAKVSGTSAKVTPSAKVSA